MNRDEARQQLRAIARLRAFGGFAGFDLTTQAGWDALPERAFLPVSTGLPRNEEPETTIERSGGEFHRDG
ncbi:hypothetical protein ACQEVM_36770 [Streptomyces sp. CA-243310]|uniref:hypothetical protein n=1 Tax=Streptomyces sp. CA-243310 TaxID=3240056 RepID=UPI003D8DB379